MEVKYTKLHPSAQTPLRQTEGSAGYDLFACLEEPVRLEPGEAYKVPLGFATEIPAGTAGFVFSRSGLGGSKGIVVAQGVGVIDSDYRGQWLVPLRNLGREGYAVQPGERVAQVIFLPVLAAEFVEAETLSKSQRGEGGFGSTGRGSGGEK